ncbi:uncharacterized protein EDB91DRAFT_1253444 [Suillus paluster]|uniref:uncharacterized protein n=1 Tax=Suillus paluster TaxID=48578 RepID=UPI001B876B3F|nr:uncharacterized protein EDB91DRAFT_1253444 [Suillus paluster]KAG1728508.1 hypothetical protein EDB91DRAFT_1253444 [Suillus paluster]
MDEFSSTLEAIGEYTIVPEWPSMPAFQALQQFKGLPDFLMFPAFLALRHQDHFTSTSPEGCSPPDLDVIHVMGAFLSFADEARKRSQSSSDALKYACHNWAFHLSRAPNPWDDPLRHIFKSFRNRNLLSWFERQWCLKGLRSCLVILSEGQKLANELHLFRAPGPSQTSV